MSHKTDRVIAEILQKRDRFTKNFRTENHGGAAVIYGGRGTVCIYQNLRRPETPRDVQFYKRGAGIHGSGNLCGSRGTDQQLSAGRRGSGGTKTARV